LSQEDRRPVHHSSKRAGVPAGGTAFQQAKALTAAINDIMAREEFTMSDTTQGKSARSAKATGSTSAGTTAGSTSAGSAATAAVGDENIAAETLRTEIPSSVVDLFDKGLARAKDAHEKAAAIFEHSTETFEEVYTCAKRGSSEYQQKLLEIGRINANAAFDMARELAEAKTLPEMFERVVAHQRKQFEAFTAQIKDLSSLTQKVVAETAEPIRNGMAEPFRIAS
jgi:phasin